MWGAIWALFWKVDDVVSADLRAAFSKGLKRVAEAPFVDVGLTTFHSLFEFLFSRDHCSYRCLIRTLCVAFFFLMFFAVLQHIASPGSTFLGSLNALSTADDKYSTPLIIFTLIIVTNGIGDWLSLGKTRYIIHRLATLKSTALLILLLLLDALLSIAIFTLHLFLFSFFAGVSVYAFEITDYEFLTMELNIDALLPIVDSLLRTMPTDLLQALLVSGKGSVFAPMLYSTLFASLWLWLFLLASATVRAASTINTVHSYLQRVGPIESKPLRVVGAVAGGICAIIWWLLAAIRFVV